MSDPVTAGERLDEKPIITDAKGLEVYGIKAGQDYRAIVGSPGGVAEHDRVVMVELAQMAGAIGYANRAAMNADLAHPNGALALVTNDATAAYNTVYRKTGASGAGSWVVSSGMALLRGQSAYEQAVANGFVGTLPEWLESLEGDVTPEAIAAQEAAEGAATIAAESAGSATSSAAAAAASAAVAAASVASAGIYVSTTAGLAATTNGQYFSVPSADSGEYLILYKNNAGVAQEIKRYPSSQAVGNVLAVVNPSSSTPTKLFEFLDKLRKLIAYIDDQGTFAVNRVLAKAGFTLGTKGREILTDPNPQTFLAVMDKARRVYFRVGVGGARVGKLTANETETTKLNGRATNNYQRIFGVATLVADPTEREVIVSYGQSLSVGIGASDGISGLVPIVKTVDQPYGNLMFPKGPRFWDGGSDLTALVPHIEQVTANGGETILGGFQSMLAQLYSHFGAPPADTKLRTIAIAPGRGETALALLRQGTDLFIGYMAAVQAAVTLNPGKVVKSRSQLWMQGESDGANANYVNEVIAFAGEVDAGVRSATGQPEKVITFAYQTNRGKSMYETSEAAKISPLVKVGTPIYWAEYNGQAGANYDDTHLSAKGYAMVGACFAVAWFSEFALGLPWRPVSLAKDARGRLRCRVEGNDLIVKYHVPFGGGLVFDNTVRPRSNQGVYLFASDGVTQKPIADVRLENRNELRLVGAAAAAGDILRIGFKSPTSTVKADAGTNLRDNMGEIVTFDDLGRVPIHNWAIGEQHVLTTQELTP